MSRLLHALLFITFLIPGCCEEPRKDPFLAPAEEIRAMIPRQWGTVLQVSVHLDWIRVPHLTANQVLRQHLKSTSDGTALYTAVEELIAQKKAERLDFMTLPVRGGQRTKNESIVEFPYPTEFDPPEVNERILLSGERAWDLVGTTTPSAFASKNTGRTFEVEATVNDDRTLIDLNLTPEWIEHLADLPWGKPPAEVQQPVFGTCKVATRMLVQNGVWQLAGLFTPPHGAPEGKLYASLEAMPAERVFLFVRAGMEAPPKPGADPEPHRPQQVTVLAEWIEVDTAVFADFLVKHPAPNDTAAIREGLEPMLQDGRAALLESAALQVRSGERSKIESLTEFPYPVEPDPPRIPQTFGGGPVPSHENPPGARVTTKIPDAFATKNTGTTLEVEATVSGDGTTIDLNLAPEMIFNLGTVAYGEGVSEEKRPKFQTYKMTTQLLTVPNRPQMIGSFDAPLQQGENQAQVQKRKVLLFVRGIL